MTASAAVALLVAWPVINIVLGAYAAWATRTGDRPGRRGRHRIGRHRIGRAESAAGSASASNSGSGKLSASAGGSGSTAGSGKLSAGGSTAGSAGGSASGSTAPDTFWVMVPCLNEERVVGRTVRAALALTAPGTETQVLVIDDASDDGTPAVLAGLLAGGDDGRLHVLRRELPAARRGKGEALNAGHDYIERWTALAGRDPARIAVGVIDGDGRGSDNLLVEVASALADPRIGAVQARVRIANRDRLLGAVQDLEFGCVADASQIMRARIGSVGLGGNGQFTRLSALRSLGPAPWSDCLVEDLELGLRLHLAGVGIGYVPRASITQQGVVHVGRLLRQRTRWAQGNLQCIRYLPQLSASPQIRSHTFIEMAYYLLAPWLNAVGSAVVALLWAYAGIQLVTGGAPVATASPAVGLALWVGALLLPGLAWAVLHRLRLGDESLSRCLAAGLFYPVFLLLGLISTWRALGRQVLGRNGWAKTERLADEPAPAFAY
jgi:glycosyltransferase involved in cell wall biosynthesis